MSTACIDGLDATLQAGVPRLMAAMITKPHPLNLGFAFSSFDMYLYMLLFEYSILFLLKLICGCHVFSFPKNNPPCRWLCLFRTFSAYQCASVAENVVNHSGLDHWLPNLIFLKGLPFRAGVAVHDAHHRFSNYSKNAKNFGENFWLWDWATWLCLSYLEEVLVTFSRLDSI